MMHAKSGARIDHNEAHIKQDITEKV